MPYGYNLYGNPQGSRVAQGSQRPGQLDRGGYESPPYVPPTQPSARPPLAPNPNPAPPIGNGVPSPINPNRQPVRRQPLYGAATGAPGPTPYNPNRSLGSGVPSPLTPNPNVLNFNSNPAGGSTPQGGGQIPNKPVVQGWWTGQQENAFNQLSAIDPKLLWAWNYNQQHNLNAPGQIYGQAEAEQAQSLLPPRLMAQVQSGAMTLQEAVGRHIQFLRSLGLGGGV